MSQRPVVRRRRYHAVVVVLVLASLVVVEGAAVAVPSPGPSTVSQPGPSAEERASAAPLPSGPAPAVARNEVHGDFSDEPPTASGLVEVSKSVPVDAPGSKHSGAARPLPAPVAVPRKGCVAPLVSVAPVGDRQVVDAAPKGCEKQGGGFVGGESRVIDELTTPTEQVFANPDGSRTSKLSTAPVRFRDVKGVWREIDLDLEVSGSGLRAKAAQFPVTMPSDPSKGLVEVSTPVGTFAMASAELAEGLGAPTVKGRSAVFAASGSGRSVRVSALSSGFEQDTILPDRGVPASYGVEFTLPVGVTARQSAAGVEFVDDHGVVLASFAGGVAYDSKINDAPGVGAQTSVATTLVDVTGTLARVSVSVDEAWLSDPARVFPVTVDPVYQIQTSAWIAGTADTYTSLDWPGTHNGESELKLGSYADAYGYPYGYAETFLRFPLTQIQGPDVTVTEAHISLWNTWTSSCDASVPIYAVGLGGTWDPNTLTESNAPPDDGQGLRASANFARGNGCAPADWVTIDATSLAQEWARTVFGYAHNDGVVLFAQDWNDVRSWRRFSSAETGSATAPTLTVTYTRAPPVPTMVAPLHESLVTTTTPILQWNPVTDPDGDPVSYAVRVTTGSDAESGTIVYNSGAMPASSFPYGTWLQVPAGRLREGETYYWHVWAGDPYAWAVPQVAWKFAVNQRLGAGQPSPYDAMGPATVNLATGNLTVATSSPNMATVGGGIGLNYLYNSQDGPEAGLMGSYFGNQNLTGAPQRRIDQQVNFDWTTGAPTPGGIPPDHFSVRWNGYVTVPTSGTYNFGAISDDGVRIWVDDLNTAKLDMWSSGGHYGWGSAQTLQAGKPYPIKVEYFEDSGPASMKLWAVSSSFPAGPVPASWLSPGTQSLSPGWRVTLGGTVNYDSLFPGWGFATISGTDGSKHMFIGTTGGWVPAWGEVGSLARDTAGGWWFLPNDGLYYWFTPDGVLSKVYQANDDTQVAAAEFTWKPGLPPRVTSILDPVSTRHVDLTYGEDGGCPTMTGYDATPPANAVCKVSYWDGTQSQLFYSSGQFARLVDPGGETTSFQYTGGKVSAIRDALAQDAGATGPTGQTDIVYDSSGRVASVTLPEPETGETRASHSYGYTFNTFGDGTATVTTPGLPSATVAFDDKKRETSSTGIDGLTTTKTWHPAKDLLFTTTDPAGLRSSRIYDWADRLTDTYGPAPQAWFDGSGLPVAAHAPPATGDQLVPHARTGYDEGLQGLSVAYYANTGLNGVSVAHSLSFGDAGGQISHVWNNVPPTSAPGFRASNWSARLTGDIAFPSNGLYTVAVNAGGGVRLWIDDQLAIDAWDGVSTIRVGYFNNKTGTTPHRMKLEYFQPTTSGALVLTYAPYGGTATVVPGSSLFPRYNLATSTTDPDGHYNTTTYTEPWGGRPATSTVDAIWGGQNLTTSYTYETNGTDQYRRQLTRTLPAGNTWTYGYYDGDYVMPSGTVSPCGSGGISQGGALKTRTGPVDANGVRRVEEFVYDAAGKPLGSRVGNDPWTCITYDARERPLTKTIPAYGSEAARTVTYNYAVAGNALTTSVTDPVGTISTTVDLLGRARSSTDVWNKTVTTDYDQYGRVTQSAGPRPSDSTVNSYYGAGDPAYKYGKLKSVAVDGATTATVDYDSAGRTTTVNYPTGTGNNGNGTSLAPIVRDALGRTVGLTWNDPSANTITSDTVTRTTGGDVTDQTIDGTDADPTNPNFVYDTAGRLTTAKITGHTYTYGYATPTGCPTATLTTAAKNTNRTTVTDNATTTQANCYDAADKLISTSQSGYATLGYDAHGNTTTLGTERLGYDMADRHITSTVGTTQVRYTRDATDNIVERTVATLSAPATIAHRASSSTGGSASSSSITLNKPAGTETGDVLIAHIGVNLFGSLSVNPPAGWTPIANNANGTNVQSSTFWHVATAGDPANWAFALSSGRPASGGIVAYSGVDTANPIDSVAIATNASGSSHAAPAVTTSVANERVVSLYAVKANSTFTPPSGSTERVDAANTNQAPVTVEAADTNVAAAGTVAAKTATSTAAGVSATQTIVLRPAPGTPTVTATTRYSAGITMDANNNVIERTYGLPGGASVTTRSTSQVWSYPNVHGDTVATANASGVKQGATTTYDPYGNLNTGTLPDNSDGNLDHGWIGGQPSEHEAGLTPVVEMGARQYDPKLGRFLEVDPVVGGSCNDYGYTCGDPNNVFDKDGECEWCSAITGKLALLLSYLDALSPRGDWLNYPLVGRGATAAFNRAVDQTHRNYNYWQRYSGLPPKHRDADFALSFGGCVYVCGNVTVGLEGIQIASHGVGWGPRGLSLVVSSKDMCKSHSLAVGGGGGYGVTSSLYYGVTGDGYSVDRSDWHWSIGPGWGAWGGPARPIMSLMWGC